MGMNNLKIQPDELIMRIYLKRIPSAGYGVRMLYQ